MPAIRDEDIYDDIVARLEATGKFAGVILAVDQGRRGADDWPLAVVEEADWDDLDDADSGDAVDLVHRGRFAVSLLVREEADAAQFGGLRSLERAARNAINGQSLAGVTFPAMTVLRRARMLPAGSPNKGWSLQGEFTYIVAGFDAFEP